MDKLCGLNEIYEHILETWKMSYFVGKNGLG